MIDEEGNHRPKGIKETDHNTILVEMKIEIKKPIKKVTRWNIKEDTDWKKYNTIIQEPPNINTYEEFGQRINKALEATVGKKRYT